MMTGEYMGDASVICNLKARVNNDRSKKALERLEEVYEYWHGQALACAHNEWFNMLVTQGILGVIAYIGIFVTALIRGAKTAKYNPVVIPLMALVVAYMSHNFFCYQQCICTPVVFIAMAMIELQARWKGEPESRL